MVSTLNSFGLGDVDISNNLNPWIPGILLPYQNEGEDTGVPEEFPDMTRYDLQLIRQGRERADSLFDGLDQKSRDKIRKITAKAVELNRTVLDDVVGMAYRQADRENLR